MVLMVHFQHRAEFLSIYTHQNSSLNFSNFTVVSWKNRNSWQHQ